MPSLCSGQDSCGSQTRAPIALRLCRAESHPKIFAVFGGLPAGHAKKPKPNFIRFLSFEEEPLSSRDCAPNGSSGSKGIGAMYVTPLGQSVVVWPVERSPAAVVGGVTCTALKGIDSSFPGCVNSG